jgi:hypothetical protein
VVTGLDRERAAVADALLGSGVGELAAELGDEGRHVPELPETPQALQRGDLVVEEPFVDYCERELPRRRLDLRRELLERGWFAHAHGFIMDRRADAQT